MSATFDINAVVNILSGAPAVEGAVFNVPLTVHNDVTFTAALVRSFTSSADANADSEMSAASKAAVAAAFQQEPRIGLVKVGKATDVTTPYDDLDADLDAILAEDSGWYGLNVDTRDEASILDAAAWTEANDRLYAAQTSDAPVLVATAGNVLEDLQGFGYDRTMSLWHAEDLEHASMAWLAHRLVHDPDLTSTIWVYAGLTGVLLQDLTTTEAGNVEGQNGNWFGTFKGLRVIGKEGILASGNFIDTRITKDWFKQRGEERLAQALADQVARGSKHPFEDEGINALVGEIRGLAEKGERLNHFRAGSTVIQQPLVEDIDTADVAARQLNISGETILAGAVQKTTFNFAILAA